MLRAAILTLLLAATVLPGMEERFRAYWYDQGAEISRYALRQVRYGEVREGDAVLVYVTEPLSIPKRVKSDDPEADDAVLGLKLNHRRTFTTGVYPYACMTTILQPIEPAGAHALKVTTSVQEWCGHVWDQLGRRDDGWDFQLHSYFEAEGEQARTLAAAWCEDELWTRLRLDPSSLPEGRVTMIPGALYRRFAHHPARGEQAVVSIIEREAGLRELAVRYLDLDRKLRITFEGEFPHSVIRWRETHGDQETTAERTHRIYGPYWQWNDRASESRRAELGLRP